MKWIIPRLDRLGRKLELGERVGAGNFLLLDATNLTKRRKPPAPIVSPFLHRKSVAILGGYSASFKTWLAMSLAVCVATGKPWLGHYGSRRGAVAYISWEGNREVFAQRLQSLLLGLGVAAGTLSHKDFALCVRPHRWMLNEGFDDDIALLAAKYDLIVIDSFGAAAPGLDENAASSRGPLDRLHTIALDHDCSFLVIHHSGKSKGRPGQQDHRESLRGSSAIFAAADEVLLVERRKESVALRQTKCRTAREREPFFARLQELSKPIGAKVFEVIDRAEEHDRSKKDLAKNLRKKILSYVAAHPSASKTDIVEAVGGRRQGVARIVDRLVEAGRLRNTGSTGRPKLSVPHVRGPTKSRIEENRE